jgi:hypothetical protein
VKRSNGDIIVAALDRIIAEGVFSEAHQRVRDLITDPEAGNQNFAAMMSVASLALAIEPANMVKLLGMAHNLDRHIKVVQGEANAA